MNNLHRELAPVSSAAWDQIEEEAARTLKRFLAARRVVDVHGPHGLDFSAVGTGHTRPIDGPEAAAAGRGPAIFAVQREAQPLVELRVPFELTRLAIDDVERGALDADWAALKEAARQAAYAEDSAVFDGYAAAGIGGIRSGASTNPVSLPADVMHYPEAVAAAVDELRLAGVGGPYCLVLGGEAYRSMSGGSDEGYPVIQHVQRLVDGDIVWAPAIEGGLVMSTRGGDFALDLGQDLSIGYLGHSAQTVTLYLQESFTFRLLTTEAAVALTSGVA